MRGAWLGESVFMFSPGQSQEAIRGNTWVSFFLAFVIFFLTTSKLSAGAMNRGYPRGSLPAGTRPAPALPTLVSRSRPRKAAVAFYSQFLQAGPRDCISL